MTPPKPLPENSVMELKIVLERVTPVVWRRIRVPADVKLPMLSRLLLAAMGWTDTHLHEFRAGRTTYMMPENHDGFTGNGEERILSEVGVPLFRMARRKGVKFKFIYDFGDYWVHTVTVERVRVAEPGESRQETLAGKNSCPPEDCGGPDGYARMRAILRDPAHPEHRELSEWRGGKSDPAEFALEDHQIRPRRATNSGG